MAEADGTRDRARVSDLVTQLLCSAGSLSASGKSLFAYQEKLEACVLVYSTDLCWAPVLADVSNMQGQRWELYLTPSCLFQKDQQSAELPV